MENFSKRTWAQINLNSVDYNFYNIKKKLSPSTKILCVLKADAYGHGAEYLVREYEKLGADYYGVSNLDEAVQLRNSGAKKPILIFGYTPPEMAVDLCNYNITQAVFSLEYANKLEKACREGDFSIKAHIKIDSGMSRIGFFCQNKDEIKKSTEEILNISRTMPHIIIEGIFTHFSVSDDITNNEEYTRFQFKNFKSAIDILERKGVKFKLRHCCNSGGILNFPEMQLDMVRAGVILYGLYPSEETRNKIDLKPVMELKSVVSQVKTIPEGTSLSYGRTFTSNKNITVASVTIGYADGYSLRFSNNSQLLVRGEKANIVGRVCMDQLMIDVSNIKGVKEGDVVTVFGKDDKTILTVDELAKKIGTINYEIVCLIGKRVPRIYFYDNEVVGKVIYI